MANFLSQYTASTSPWAQSPTSGQQCTYTVVPAGSFWGIHGVFSGGGGTFDVSDPSLPAACTVLDLMYSFAGNTAQNVQLGRSDLTVFATTPDPWIAPNIAGSIAAIATLFSKCVDALPTFITSMVVNNSYLSLAAQAQMFMQGSQGGSPTGRQLMIATQRYGGLGNAYNSSTYGAPLVPAKTQPVTVLINNRRFISAATQLDLSGVSEMSTQPVNIDGMIIGPGNPSVVTIGGTSTAGCSDVADVDIDLQDDQQIFTPIGAAFTTLGSAR